MWLVMIGSLIGKTVLFSPGEETAQAAISGVINETHRDWMEIYLKDSKIGYSVTQVSPLGDDYLIQEEVLLRLNLMGQATDMRTFIRSIMDHDFVLKSFVIRIDSGVTTFQASGIVKKGRLCVEEGEGGRKKSHSINLSGPPVIGAGMTQFFRGRPLEVGKSFKFHLFDPSTMIQKEVVIEVAARETVVVGREKQDAFRLETTMWGQDLIFWLDSEGRLQKERGFMGFTLVRSNAEDAPLNLKGGGQADFYSLAAIDIKPGLRDTHRLTYVRLKVSGLDETDFDAGLLNRGRQRFQSGILEIYQEKGPVVATDLIPYPELSVKMKPYLAPELNIESDDRAIKESAREIAGNHKDPVELAKRLMEWVYKNVKKRPVIGIPSALEVLRTRVGDCNEHAFLLTALLRAAGIPARVCTGLVAVENRFLYHAWTEGFFGGWISMDATLNQMPADATHIKLVHGGLDRQVKIIGLIGRLKLEIIDYRYE